MYDILFCFYFTPCRRIKEKYWMFHYKSVSENDKRAFNYYIWKTKKYSLLFLPNWWVQKVEHKWNTIVLETVWQHLKYELNFPNHSEEQTK